MSSWTRSVAALLLIVCAGLWTAPVAAEPAQVDSLVWYIEELEHDLAVCQIRGEATADSLAIRCDLLGEELALAQKEQRRWFHDPRLWFLAGAALGVYVSAQAVRASF
jgi:hypothetical protein